MRPAFLQDSGGQYICITTLPARWSLKPGQRPSDEGIFGPEIGARLKELKAGLTKPGDRAELEIEAGDDTFFEFRCRFVEMSSQEVNMLTVVMDRTEDRRRERLLRALLREVVSLEEPAPSPEHRVAARRSGTLRPSSKFRGHAALSQSQDLITDSSWRGAYFRDLLKQQVDRYVQENGDLVKVSGEDVLLTPNSSLHIGLALHELIVNAVSHGDFLARRRAIEVNCERIEAGTGPQIRVTWIEPVGPLDDAAIAVAKTARFGSTVLERVVPSSVNGHAHHRVERDQVRYDLTFPQEIYE
jgi:hypothetical protein